MLGTGISTTDQAIYGPEWRSPAGRGRPDSPDPSVIRAPARRRHREQDIAQPLCVTQDASCLLTVP